MVIGWRYTPYGCTAPAPPGECTRGGSAERFEPPLVGGAARSWRLGGNPPTPAFPRRGKRERGRFKFRAPQANYQRGCPGNLSSDGHPASPYSHSKAGIPLTKMRRKAPVAPSVLRASGRFNVG